jgi:hypothetical protein
MHRDLERQPIESAERAAASRSFLINYESDLSKQTNKIIARRNKISLPSLIINDIEKMDYCSLDLGVEGKTGLPVWQITLRPKERKKYGPVNDLLYGRITQKTESWRHITSDFQGRMRHQAYVEDPTGIIGGFVLDALQAADVEGVSIRLMHKKEETAREHDAYAGKCADPERYGADKRGTSLRAAYSQIGFRGTGVLDSMHVEMSNRDKGGPPLKMQAEEMPVWILGALNAPEFSAVAASTPELKPKVS